VRFTVAQTARLTGTTPAQLRSWERLRLVVPGAEGAEHYSFRDLVALRIVTSLLDAGLSLARIRRALQYLVQSGDDVAALSLVTDGESVWACRDDCQVLDALRQGQLAFFVAVGPVAAEVEADVRAFDAERQAFVDDLRAAPAEPAPGTSGATTTGRAGVAAAREVRHRPAAPS
jgi:DNA-binding transcriptional MerR regulator